MSTVPIFYQDQHGNYVLMSSAPGANMSSMPATTSSSAPATYAYYSYPAGTPVASHAVQGQGVVVAAPAQFASSPAQFASAPAPAYPMYQQPHAVYHPYPVAPMPMVMPTPVATGPAPASSLHDSPRQPTNLASQAAPDRRGSSITSKGRHAPHLPVITPTVNATTAVFAGLTLTPTPAAGTVAVATSTLPSSGVPVGGIDAVVVAITSRRVHIVTMCADAAGSLALQHLFSDPAPSSTTSSGLQEQRAIVGAEVASFFVDIMTDKRGNYVCQKYFTFCDTAGRRALWSRLESSHRTGMAAIDPYGWRVLQHMVVTGQAHPELLGAMQAALAPQLSTILSANNGVRLFQGMSPPLSLCARCCAPITPRCRLAA